VSSLPKPGEHVGPYGIVRELARGGMGAVFVARGPADRDVALKVLLAGFLDDEARFRREAEACAKLNHPGIVRVHDLGQDAGHTYIVMDLIPGASLHDRLKGGPLPPEEAVDAAIQLVDAVAAAHQAGVLHRDIKPDNAIATPDGRVILTDFGLAKRVDQHDHLTRTGAILGTPAFMAPEQANGEPVDERADVYALGATFYALLTGRPPLEGSSPLALLSAVLTTPPNPPSTHVPLSPAHDAVCMKCLEKAPDDRYPSAAALLADLRALGEGRPVSVAVRRSRPPVAAVAAAAAGVVALLVAGAVALIPPAPPPPPPSPLSVPSTVPFDEAAFDEARISLDTTAGRGLFLYRAAAYWNVEPLAARGRELLNLVPGFPWSRITEFAPPIPRFQPSEQDRARAAEQMRLRQEINRTGQPDRLVLPYLEEAYRLDRENATVLHALARSRVHHSETHEGQMAGLSLWFEYLRQRPSQMALIVSLLHYRLSFSGFTRASLKDYANRSSPPGEALHFVLKSFTTTPTTEQLARLDLLLTSHPDLAGLLLVRARLAATLRLPADQDLEDFSALHAAQTNPVYQTMADQFHEVGLAWARCPSSARASMAVLRRVGSLGHRQDPPVVALSTVQKAFTHWLNGTDDFARVKGYDDFEVTAKRIVTLPADAAPPPTSTR
jgi:hypothetical protein